MNIQKCTFKTVTILGASFILHMYSTVCKRVIHQKAFLFFFHPHALLLYAYVHVDVCACHYISVQLFLDVAAKSVLFLQFSLSAHNKMVLGTFTNSKTVVSFYDLPTICQNSVNYWKNNYNKLLLFVCLI